MILLLTKEYAVAQLVQALRYDFAIRLHCATSRKVAGSISRWSH